MMWSRTVHKNGKWTDCVKWEEGKKEPRMDIHGVRVRFVFLYNGKSVYGKRRGEL